LKSHDQNADHFFRNQAAVKTSEKHAQVTMLYSVLLLLLAANDGGVAAPHVGGLASFFAKFRRRPGSGSVN